jgi:hypothetical protein
MCAGPSQEPCRHIESFMISRWIIAGSLRRPDNQTFPSPGHEHSIRILDESAPFVIGDEVPTVAAKPPMYPMILAPKQITTPTKADEVKF